MMSKQPRSLAPNMFRTNARDHNFQPARAFNEIAAIMGITRGGAHYLFHSGMTKLRNRHRDIDLMLGLAAELEKSRQAPIMDGDEEGDD